MVFNSQIFLFLLLPLCLASYYLIHAKFRNLILLLFSFVFYLWAESTYFWLIITSILFNYSFGILLYKSQKKYPLLLFSVFVNVSVLLFYKYSGFFCQTFHVKSNYLNQLILPLGISFYTFHSISYLIDIYRGKANPQTNLIKMSLYIVNFPQLIAGPIIRYHDVEKQLSFRNHISNKFRNGFKLFIYGLAKKMLIANTVGIMADVIFDKSFGSYSSIYAWIGVFSYTLQIYFDFSGYSDMAIGLGKMFGFNFKENFNLPYSTLSVRDFWQRWHISLSSWFKDYLYIPLGGNRKGNIRVAFNLILVFVLCGFWHGASFTFLIWGLFHGTFLVIERFFSLAFFDKIPKIIKHLYLWLVIMIGWVFFRSNTVTESFQIIKKLFYLVPNSITMPDVKSFVSTYFICISIIGFIISLGVFKKWMLFILKNKYVTFTKYRYLEIGLLLFLFAASVLEIINNSYNPFIYYRF
jgi:alginate O-acetyltransferase complex protein AlgI